MPRPAKYITIEGQFANGVLGTFRILRGFATLQDLAAISASFPMNLTPAADQVLAGHQRAIDPAHANAVKRYMHFRVKEAPRFTQPEPSKWAQLAC